MGSQSRSESQTKGQEGLTKKHEKVHEKVHEQAQENGFRGWLDAHPWSAILGGLAALTLFLGVVKFFAPKKPGPSYSVQSPNGSVSSTSSAREQGNGSPQNLGGQLSSSFQAGKSAENLTREGNFGSGKPPLQGPVMKNSKYQLKGAFVRPSK